MMHNEQPNLSDRMIGIAAGDPFVDMIIDTSDSVRPELPFEESSRLTTHVRELREDVMQTYALDAIDLDRAIESRRQLRQLEAGGE